MIANAVKAFMGSPVCDEKTLAACLKEWCAKLEGLESVELMKDLQLAQMSEWPHWGQACYEEQKRVGSFLPKCWLKSRRKV
eukprot:5986392-Amphidinium_carterae.1